MARTLRLAAAIASEGTLLERATLGLGKGSTFIEPSLRWSWILQLAHPNQLQYGLYVFLLIFTINE